MHNQKLLPALAMILLLMGAMMPCSAETMNGVEVLSGSWRGQEIEYLDGEILLMLLPDKSQAVFEQQISDLPVSIARQADKWGFMKLRIDEGQDLFELIEEIKQLPSVRYAEPNMVDRLLLIPNDSLFSTQWHYHNIGQNPPGGTVDADIDAPEGWDISTGSDTIIVGVLDSGIPMQNGALSHPDLDDPNRFILGKDVYNNDFEPMDDNGHGTHVSGTIGAESNNGSGVAGVAWNVKIMAIKVFSASGSGSHEAFRDGCIYGVDNGCKVLNYSGGGSAGETKEHGVAYADSNDVVLCAAAGNNWQGSVDWPGAYSLSYDNVICVSATDADDESSPFSSIGAQVTVAAPGGYGSPYDEDDIQSTFPNYACYLTTNYGLPQNYSPLAGTSMATPHVAGFAALILSMNPGLTPDSVRQIMINTADDLGPAGFDSQFGWGRINVYNALSQMGSVIITHTPLPDTRDSLNDYEVEAKIWSVNDLVADSLLLYYEVNSTWSQEVMTSTGETDMFHAYIPAQSPGTTINYYIYAQNIDGDADTTDTYTFSVLDYGILLEPSYEVTAAPAYDTVWYAMKVTNNGIFEDSYILSSSGNLWGTSLWDQTQTVEINTTSTLLSGEYLDFYARVIIPSTLEGEYDSVIVSASSTEQSGLSVEAVLKTISTGEPWEIPFTDLFATASFDDTKWESTDGAEINTVGIGEPSVPYSVNLNGDPDGGDQVVTEMINLKDQSNVVVKYWYERTGGGESPDTDDDLYVEYLDSDSNWVVLYTHLGSGEDMEEFEEMEHVLPSEAMHAGFRLSFRCTATSGAYDDWFIDDVYVGHPSDYKVAVNPSFQSEYGPAGGQAVYTITVINKGYLDDNFDLSYTGDWTVEFYDENGINPISSTDLIPGGDSTNVVVKIGVPAGTPLHTANTSTIYATSHGDTQISAYVFIETISAGSPALIPWYETFPYDTLYTQRWFTYTGVDIGISAPGTPTAPYSLNLDGGTDTLITQLIDLSGNTDVLLTYYYEKGGGGDLPETGDNLWVDYRNSSGVWTNLMTHDGGGTAMDEFEYVILELPPDAYHDALQIRFHSYGSDSGEDDWFVDNIRIDQSPAMSAYPGMFSETLTIGDSARGDLIIENSGLGELIYNVKVNPHLTTKASEIVRKIYPSEVYESQPEKGENINYRGEDVVTGIGGPDLYGYYWLDSDNEGGPEFDWINVSSTGEDLIGSLDDDNYIGPFDLGFDFPFYGVTYDQVYIGSNGIVGFLESTMNSRTPRPFPTASSPNAIIALLWDDLDPTDYDNSDAHVFFHTNSERCVIQFEDYPEYHADAGDVVTMEIILFSDGRLKLQYRSIAAGFDAQNCGVGIENSDGTDGLEVVYMASYLHDNLAVEFFKPFDWLVLDQYEGLLTGGSADTITCRFVTGPELEVGTHTADIVISCNDPDNLTQTISAQLEVVEEPQYICGDANGSQTVDVSDAVYVINYIFVSGPAPEPYEAGDVNCDLLVNVSDAVYIINYVFIGGDEPCADCQ